MSTPATPTTAHVVRTDGEWDALRTAWAALFAASPRAVPPLHFDWLRTWWRVYGPHYAKPGSLRILTIRRGPELVGVVPLYLQVTGPGLVDLRRLRFVSTGEAQDEEVCPDYLDLLHRPGEEAACVDAARTFLARSGWDHLDLSDLSESSPLLSLGGSVGGQVVPTYRCPVADLTGGFEAYLGRLTGNGRHQARRLIRNADKAGAVFEVAGPDRGAEFFADLVRLHQERWAGTGEPGVFASARFTGFHRSLAEAWVPEGRAVLSRLSVDGRPVAALYGFRVGRTYYGYQSGVVAGGALSSPGNLAHLLLMRDLAGQGVTCYDLLRGSSTYKDRLTTGENKLVALRAWRPTVRAALHRSARALAAGLRRIRRKPAPASGVASATR